MICEKYYSDPCPDRHGPRLQMLLLVSTLASFHSWLAGLGCEVTGAAHWLQPCHS